MKGKLLVLVVTLVVFSLCLGLVAGCAAPQGQATTSAADFYKGKTISWVCTPSGDAIDVNARIIAPFLSKETGATIRVENMESDVGPNYVWSAKPDGLSLVSNAITSFWSKDLLKSPGTIFKIEEFNWIADMNPSYWIVSVNPKRTDLMSLAGLKSAKGIKWASSVARGSLHGAGAAVIEALGLDAKVILGYAGGSGSIMAVGQGECDVISIADSTTLKSVQGGLIKPVFATADKRSPVFPDVPNWIELGVKIPANLQGIVDYTTTGGYAVVMTPGVPKDRVDYLRNIFTKLNSNKELKEQLKKAGNITDFVPGEKMQELAVKVKKSAAEISSQLIALCDKTAQVKK